MKISYICAHATLPAVKGCVLPMRAGKSAAFCRAAIYFRLTALNRMMRAVISAHIYRDVADMLSAKCGWRDSTRKRVESIFIGMTLF